MVDKCGEKVDVHLHAAGLLQRRSLQLADGMRQLRVARPSVMEPWVLERHVEALELRTGRVCMRCWSQQELLQHTSARSVRLLQGRRQARSCAVRASAP